MKKILVSDKSESVAKILNGDKTVKVMKTAPKCELPIEVYIYCTRSAPYLHPWNEPAAIEPGGPRGTNKVTWKKSWRLDKAKRYMSWNGKVVAKFTLSKIERVVSCIAKDWGDDPWEMRYSLRLEESDTAHNDDRLMDEGGFEYLSDICDYLGFDFPISNSGFGERPDFEEGVVYGYAWHISDLEIFDEPKELSEFYSSRLDKDVTKLLDNSIQLSNGKWVKRLDKAPLSWRYVEEDE